MHLPFTTVAGILALASSARGSTVLVNNYCTKTLWVTLVNSSQVPDGPFQLPSGQAYSEPIDGDGNSLGITTNNTYYSSQTSKLILGTSSDSGELWWSISDVDGNPFQNQSFNVTSPSGSNPNACGSANSPDKVEHSCADANVTLTLNCCSVNS